MKLKRFSIFFVLTITIFLLAGFTFARELEVPLPQPGGEEMTETPLLPDYIKYIFNFSIGIAGLIAFIMLVYGGFRYVTSVGNPSAMSDANTKIFSALIGLVVILSSYLILTTINPRLIIINPQAEESGLVVEETPGVYLCKEKVGEEEDCQLFTDSKSFVGGEFDNSVSYIRIENPTQCKDTCAPEDCDEPQCRETTDSYFAVLHRDKYYKGDCAVCFNDRCNEYNSIAGVGGVSSIEVFRHADQGSFVGEGVSLYEKSEYNERCRENQNCWSWGPMRHGEENDIGENGKSIKIEEGGKYAAIIFKSPNYTNHCEVFTHGTENIASHPIANCGNWITRDLGCFGSIIVRSIK